MAWKRIAIGLWVVVAMAGCKTETASMTRIGLFDGDEAQLRALYDQHQCPLVLVGRGIYLPPDQCLCRNIERVSRAAPPETSEPTRANEEAPEEPLPNKEPDNRQYAGLAEHRIIGGFAEQRVFGGGNLPIKCTTHGDCKGFEVVVPLGGDVRYFDGKSVKPAKDGFVPIR